MIDSFENAPELIRVEDLHKSFGGLNVLNGITETIHKGEVVSLIGPSGSGKSTFLRCLNRLEEPTSGHIWFDGVDIADKSVNIDKHRQKMGMVFQHFNIFPRARPARQNEQGRGRGQGGIAARARRPLR